MPARSRAWGSASAAGGGGAGAVEAMIRQNPECRQDAGRWHAMTRLVATGIPVPAGSEVLPPPGLEPGQHGRQVVAEDVRDVRLEEHTAELQSLMRIS